MTMDPQYRKAIEQINADGEDFANQQMQTVYKNQKEHLDELHTFLGLLYIKYAIDGLLNLSVAVKASIIAQIDSKLKAMGKDLGQTEVNKVTDILKNSYSDVYYKNAFVMNKSFDVNLKFNILKDEHVNAAVNSKLNGKLFSDRIWQNKADMIDKLHKSLMDITNGKATIDKAGKMIQETFNVGAYESKRLMITELTRVQSQAQNDIASNAGIKQHMWSATLDRRTCPRCAGLDGKIFDIDDNSSPQMPLHPLDRCCWINVPFPDWKPTKRKDNETKEIIDYKTYNEWLKNKGDNGLNNKNRDISMPESTILHSNVGEFSNPKNPKKQMIGKFKSGGHGQENINILQNNNIEYNVVKEYPNGVRIGNVPSHKMPSKRSGTGQAWFPEQWTQEDIEKAGQYVANLKDKFKYILDSRCVNGEPIAIFKYGNYKNVTVGVCYDVKKKKVTTVFPDETQRMLGGEER